MAEGLTAGWGYIVKLDRFIENKNFRCPRSTEGSAAIRYHTFAKALLDPAAYGLDRPPMPLPALQQLLGHADIATTTIYTRISADDLARMMGTSEAY